MANTVLKVNIEEISRAALARLPSKSDQQRMVQGLGAAATAFWKRLAQQRLRSTSRDYVQGLTMDTGDRRVTITLDGVLPNMVENGFQGGDMRRWMLSGPRAKKGKNGRYLIVPFQHGSPGTGGRNVGPTMPTSVHDAARMLKGSLSRTSRETGLSRTVKYGGRLSEHSAGVDAQAHQLLTTLKKPWHTSSIYQGMVRNEKMFKRAKQTTGYTTFRVISESTIRGARDKDGSALEHWFHPGIRAAHFARQTQQHVRKLAGAMLAGATQDPPGSKRGGTRGT